MNFHFSLSQIFLNVLQGLCSEAIFKPFCKANFPLPNFLPSGLHYGLENFHEFFYAFLSYVRWLGWKGFLICAF
jgi:hypothetical protein